MICFDYKYSYFLKNTFQYSVYQEYFSSHFLVYRRLLEETASMYFILFDHYIYL